MDRFTFMRIIIPALMLAACVPAASPPPAQFRPIAIAGPLLAAHNRERAGFGSPPLAWDPGLAAVATAYANQLAREGRLRHSPKQQRPGQGEICGSDARRLPVATMIAVDERAPAFPPWAIPQQQPHRPLCPRRPFHPIIWPTTSRVGCGIADRRVGGAGVPLFPAGQYRWVAIAEMLFSRPSFPHCDGFFGGFCKPKHSRTRAH